MSRRTATVTVGAARARLCTLVVCRGCCCGNPRKYPGTDHTWQLDRLRAAVAEHGLLVRTTDCGRDVITAAHLDTAVGMEQSAVSHQLRLLRTLGLVTGRRDGRRIVYRLHDDHVAQLLDQAVHHIEHLRLGVRDPG